MSIIEQYQNDVVCHQAPAKKAFGCINSTGQNLNMTHNPTYTNQITKQASKYGQMRRKSKHLRSNVPRIQIRSPMLNPESESNGIASELAMHHRPASIQATRDPLGV